MSFFRHICLTLAFLSGALMAAGDAYAAPASAPAADPAAQLEALLDEHPELILNVLKKHSEEVLDIVQMGSDKRRRTVLLEQWKKDINEPKQVAVQGRPAGGPDNAPVTIIAFSDFVCAYCHQAAYTVGNLMKRYPGKIRLIFKQIPKTESGRMAAEAAVAAIDAGDTSAAGLAPYKAAMEGSFVIQDLRTFSKWPHVMEEGGSMFTDYPVMVKEVFNAMFSVDGAPQRPLMKRMGPIIKKRGVLKLGREVMKAVKAL